LPPRLLCPHPAHRWQRELSPPLRPASATRDRPPLVPVNERNAVERANIYFNNMTSLVSDFAQTSADGRPFAGKLYLQRPGKLRFEYKNPGTLDVIADGTSVAVRDRKLATQDLYAIGQTPLKFLLRERIDLSRDLIVKGVVVDDTEVRIQLEDQSTLGGTSRITLIFDPFMETLRRWRIIDAQGGETTITLANIERGRKIDQNLFAINYERVIEDRR
jgi:outer membrane lipoprotein-sorting protein